MAMIRVKRYHDRLETYIYQRFQKMLSEAIARLLLHRMAIALKNHS
jgi:hypothetical protein